jgi:hypothetical protein
MAMADAGGAVSESLGWKEITFANLLALRVPQDVLHLEVQGIDSEIAEWRGKKVKIRIDYGLFSDRLTSYDSREGYVEREELISGLPVRFVEFQEADESRFVAAYFFDLSSIGVSPRSLTVVVRASDPSATETARRIVRSIEFVNTAK